MVNNVEKESRREELGNSERVSGGELKKEESRVFGEVKVGGGAIRMRVRLESVRVRII